MRLLRRLVVAALAASFGVLALTGFWGWWGPTLRGWPLLIHVAAAPFFFVPFTLLVIWGAERCTPGPGSKVGRAGRALFWGSVASGVLCLGSIQLAMEELFGHEGQETLYNVHRYSSLALLALAVAFLVRWLPRRSLAQKVNAK